MTNHRWMSAAIVFGVALCTGIVLFHKHRATPVRAMPPDRAHAEGPDRGAGVDNQSLTEAGNDGAGVLLNAPAHRVDRYVTDEPAASWLDAESDLDAEAMVMDAAGASPVAAWSDPETGLSLGVIVDEEGAEEIVLVIPPSEIADADADGSVTSEDLDRYKRDHARGSVRADLNEDGSVDGHDMAIFLRAWNAAK